MTLPEIVVNGIFIVLALFTIWISFRFQSQASKINYKTLSLLESIKQSSKTVEEKTFKELEKYGEFSRAVLSGSNVVIQALSTQKDIVSEMWTKELSETDKSALDLFEDTRRRTYEDHLTIDELSRNSLMLGFKGKISEQTKKVVLEVLNNAGISVKHLIAMKYKNVDIGWMVGFLEVLGMIKYLPPLTISNFTDLRLYINPVVRELLIAN